MLEARQGGGPFVCPPMFKSDKKFKSESGKWKDSRAYNYIPRK